MLDHQVIDKYRLAGLINAEAEQEARSLVRPGLKVLELARKIEGFIKEKGGRPAFPVNISLDDCAAHYSPRIGDEMVIPDEGLLKIDVGVHVDGYISDHAFTINIDDTGGLHAKLVESSEKALENAIKAFKPGVNLAEIGGIIENTIKSYGFLPIRNLGGHSLGRYDLHSGAFVPNVGSGAPGIVKVGDVFAIEPFSTNGDGYIVDGEEMLIYRYNKRPRKQIPMRLRGMLTTIQREFSTLPFSPRWLVGKYPPGEIMPMLSVLERKQLIQGYYLLMEHGKGLVSQAEHTIIVYEDHVEVTTLLP